MQHKKLFSFVFLFTFFLISSFVFCQEKGIVLMKKDSSSTEFLQENKRIKVKLANSKTYYGRFKIENDSTFSIKGNIISLDSIVKIKRRSMTATILSPIIIVYGTAFTVAGVVLVASTLTYGALFGSGLIFCGIPMVLIPAISSNHSPDKWNYSIGPNPKIETPK